MGRPIRQSRLQELRTRNKFVRSLSTLCDTIAAVHKYENRIRIANKSVRRTPCLQLLHCAKGMLCHTSEPPVTCTRRSSGRRTLAGRGKRRTPRATAGRTRCRHVHRTRSGPAAHAKLPTGPAGQKKVTQENHRSCTNRVFSSR